MAHIQNLQKKTSTMSLTISSSSSASSRQLSSSSSSSSSSSAVISQRHSSLSQPPCVSPQQAQNPLNNQFYSGTGVAPTFVKCLHDVTTVKGQLVVFECRLRGTPPLQVMWYREDEQILDSDDFRILRKKASSASVPEELCTLVITEAFPEDSGLFKCMALNPFGTVSCSAMLEVYDDLEEQPDSQTIQQQEEGSSFIQEGVSLRQEIVSARQEQEAIFQQECVSVQASSRKTPEDFPSLLRDTITLPPPEWPDSPMDEGSYPEGDFPDPQPASRCSEEPCSRSEEESALSSEGQRSPEVTVRTQTPSPPPPPSQPPPVPPTVPTVPTKAPAPKLFSPSKHSFTSSSQFGANMNLSDLPTFTPSAFPPSGFNYARPRHFIQSQAAFQAPSYESVQREAQQNQTQNHTQTQAQTQSQTQAQSTQNLVQNSQNVTETLGHTKLVSSQALSQNQTVSQSQSLSQTQSVSQSVSQTQSHFQSLNLNQNRNQSQSLAQTQIHSQANGTSKSSPSSSSVSSPTSPLASSLPPSSLPPSISLPAPSSAFQPPSSSSLHTSSLPPSSLPISPPPPSPPSSFSSLPTSSAPSRAPMRSTITLTPRVPSATGLGSATLPANEDVRLAPAAYLCSVLPSSKPNSSYPQDSSPLLPTRGSAFSQPLPISPSSSLPQPSLAPPPHTPAVVSLPASYKLSPSILPKPILRKTVAPRPSSSRSTDEDIQGSKDALIQDLEKKLRSKEARRRNSQKLSYEERMALRLLGPDNASYMFQQEGLDSPLQQQPDSPEGRHTGGLWGKQHSGTDERGNEGSAIQEKCYAPRFLQIPPDLTVEEGRFCRIDFKVGGLPTPDVCWYLDGKAIRPDDYHKMLVCEKGMLSFIIEIVTVHHAGVYECVARNRAGESRFTMKLDVLAQEVLRPPTFIQKMLNSRVLEGDTVRLECKVDASPPPQLHWKKDKDMLRIDPNRMSLYQDGSGRQCLLIERVVKSDAGWFTLSAINQAGMSTCNARLDVGTRTASAMKTAPPGSKTLKLLSSLAHLPALTVESPAQHTAPLYESEEL